MKRSQTIAAVSTPPGVGGVGMIRLSGDDLTPFKQGVLRSDPLPRKASYGPFYDADKEIIDIGIAVFFPAPHSFTGESVLELHAHGGPVVLDVLLTRCLDLGARMAEPGEFSKRAYLNDKMDLSQAEAIIDLIHAQSKKAARAAVHSLQGVFSREIKKLQQAFVDARMPVEAAIDFPEDVDDTALLRALKIRLQKLHSPIKAMIAQAEQSVLLRDGAHVVLVGSPNVGKSSLLNSLSGLDAAIVTDVPGTTRDSLSQTIILDGLPIHIIDTAGLRDTTDRVEKIGIKKTWERIKQADILLFVMDAKDPEEPSSIFKQCMSFINQSHALVVFNKIDLVVAPPVFPNFPPEQVLYSSVKTGQGLELIKKTIKKMIGFNGHCEVGLARRRHLTALNETLSCLDRALMYSNHSSELDLIAQELRLGRDALDPIIGNSTPDDLLGHIFSHFCIGK